MWNHFAVMLLGLWLMAAPGVLQYEGPERMNDHIVGPLVLCAAIVAIADTSRAVRWVNVALGCWLVLAPVLLNYRPSHAGVRGSLIGAAILGLSLIQRSHGERPSSGRRPSGRPELGELIRPHIRSVSSRSPVRRRWRKAA